MVNVKPNVDMELIPTYKDAFEITGFGGNLYFLKNRNNEIGAMKISIGRARNIEFEKMP